VARDAATIVVPSVMVGAMFVATLLAVWFAPRLGFLGGCFFLILAPSSSIVPIRDLCVEHRMYLPLAAIVTGSILGGYWLLIKDRPMRRLTTASNVVFGVCLVLGLLTFLRNRDYATDVKLWGDTVAKAPHNSRARYNYARALVALRSPTPEQAMEAKRQFEQVIEKNANSPRAHNSLGLLLLRMNDAQGAREHFTIAARLRPDFAVTHNNLGNLLAREGKLPEAIASYEQALATNPHYAEAHNNLAIALAKLGNQSEAIAHFREALRLKPDYESARQNLKLIEK
jgi:tetratricopeptide (TPR) repeat protein